MPSSGLGIAKLQNWARNCIGLAQSGHRGHSASWSHMGMPPKVLASSKRNGFAAAKGGNAEELSWHSQDGQVPLGAVASVALAGCHSAVPFDRYLVNIGLKHAQFRQLKTFRGAPSRSPEKKGCGSA